MCAVTFITTYGTLAKYLLLSQDFAHYPKFCDEHLVQVQNVVMKKALDKRDLHIYF
jgi:hypothetical protein